jgi:hypothetical protein
MEKLDVDCADCSVYSDGVSLCPDEGCSRDLFYINLVTRLDVMVLPSCVSPDGKVDNIIAEYVVLTRQFIYRTTVGAYCFCDHSRGVVLLHCQWFFIGVYARFAKIRLDGEVLLAVLASEVD